MSLDLTKFHATFFEESFENVETMESFLLRLEPTAVDAETINTIFRAAHSIKGGAGTFGFTAVAGFTHLLETLLDQMRSGSRAVTAEGIDVLLKSTDAVRELLNAAQESREANLVLVTAREAALREALGETSVAPAAVSTAPVAAVGWSLRFAPQPSLFRSGNDPLRILRELARLGTLQAEALLDESLTLTASEPEEAHLAWQLTLTSGASEAAVREVFAWVEDEAELILRPLSAPSAAAAGAGAVPASKPTLTVIDGGKAQLSKSEQRSGQDRRMSDRRGSADSSIRVGTQRIDSLINLVGELVITQAMLAQQAAALDPHQCEKLLAGLAQLDRNTRQLQESVMSIRMLPMDFVFSRFPRLVHDLAGKLGKDIRLETVGADTELDKSVIEKISDPLTHLVRNAVDHGIETTEQRLAAGKPAQGMVRLSAAHRGGHIVIEIRDDGRGLDRSRILVKARENGLAVSETMSDAEVWQLIFAPGFSTAEVVTDVSGRGVGMDVVKKNIQALGGQVDLQSLPGQGAVVTIRLPLTLAILDGMSIRVGEETYIVPLNCVVESLQPHREQIKPVAGSGHVVKVRNEYLPLVPLAGVLGIASAARAPAEGVLVLVESEGKKVALQVDELVAQQQVVIKSLEANYKRVFGISGATILGDGRVALILDVAGLVRDLHQRAAA